MRIRFARTAGRHHVARSRARQVIENDTPIVVRSSDPGRSDEYVWIGADERGEVLEVVAVERPDCLLVIHVMPVRYREPKESEDVERGEDQEGS